MATKTLNYTTKIAGNEKSTATFQESWQWMLSRAQKEAMKQSWLKDPEVSNVFEVNEIDNKPYIKIGLSVNFETDHVKMQAVNAIFTRKDGTEYTIRVGEIAEFKNL